MGNVLKVIKGCLIFIDDIIIFSETWEEHQLILKEVFSRIHAAGLKDFSVPFIVYTDASDYGLGAVLSQRRGDHECVIAYASPTLTPAERNYSTTEKECLAIVWTVNYWRPYLLGKAFDIVTDHQSLTWLQGLKEPKGRLARWILALQEYENKHRPGKQHDNADTLSRFPRGSLALVPDWSPDEDLMVGVAATEVNASWSKEEIIKAQQHDPSIFLVVQKLRCTNTAPKEDEDGWNGNEKLYPTSLCG
ncbi:Retrovirus-related Pol poly from transposon [Paramuricea clavata]|uniref:Retrovirus-related Pol poly from transposon, partial n=2 Tax=Paramuricea clavata TaxID=317549 RepID=A0A6S7HY62_PARCT|nr:Retrovirus-related Pol poly from transposon [Paramuricea clavata]